MWSLCSLCVLLKSTALHTLQRAITALAKDGQPGMAAVHVAHMNPKSVQLNELYGADNPATTEWVDGLLPVVMRECVTAANETGRFSWLSFDGPVDALWIENMNTVLDDNKKLVRHTRSSSAFHASPGQTVTLMRSACDHGPLFAHSAWSGAVSSSSSSYLICAFVRALSVPRERRADPHGPRAHHGLRGRLAGAGVAGYGLQMRNGVQRGQNRNEHARTRTRTHAHTHTYARLLRFVCDGLFFFLLFSFSFLFLLFFSFFLSVLTHCFVCLSFALMVCLDCSKRTLAGSR